MDAGWTVSRILERDGAGQDGTEGGRDGHGNGQNRNIYCRKKLKKTSWGLLFFKKFENKFFKKIFPRVQKNTKSKTCKNHVFEVGQNWKLFFRYN